MGYGLRVTGFELQVGVSAGLIQTGKPRTEAQLATCNAQPVTIHGILSHGGLRHILSKISLLRSALWVIDSTPLVRA